MAIRYLEILQYESPAQTWTWMDRDFILYALCVQSTADLRDPKSLAYVYERDLQPLPTMPTIIAWLARPTFEELGVEATTALHGEQKIEIHAPMTIPATITSQGRVVEVYDKGPGRGAVVVTQHTLKRPDGKLLATLTTSCFARSEGGCGGTSSAPPKSHRVPTRSPDVSVEIQLRPDLALLYRLTGDRNLLHADPAVAASAGFPAPILHGLCSFGISCRAVLGTFANYEPARIRSHEARFSAPVFPGETLIVDLWRDSAIVSFEARVKERGVVALKNGRCELREP
jgi:acyl dehydratase